MKMTASPLCVVGSNMAFDVKTALLFGNMFYFLIGAIVCTDEHRRPRAALRVGAWRAVFVSALLAPFFYDLCSAIECAKLLVLWQLDTVVRPFFSRLQAWRSIIRADALNLSPPSLSTKATDNQYFILVVGRVTCQAEARSFGRMPLNLSPPSLSAVHQTSWQSIFYICRGGLSAKTEARSSGRIDLNFCPPSLTAVRQNL